MQILLWLLLTITTRRFGEATIILCLQAPVGVGSISPVI
jgi:hypothetical protein